MLYAKLLTPGHFLMVQISYEEGRLHQNWAYTSPTYCFIGWTTKFTKNWFFEILSMHEHFFGDTWSCTASNPTALSFPCLCLCLCPQGAIEVHLLPCMFSPLLSSANCTNRTSDFWTHVTLESAAALMELLNSLPISFLPSPRFLVPVGETLWSLPFLSEPSPIIVYPCH